MPGETGILPETKMSNDSISSDWAHLQKACTKKKHCEGLMKWVPEFRFFGPNGGPPYRPAWVCDKCGRHDYMFNPVSTTVKRRTST